MSLHLLALVSSLALATASRSARWLAALRRAVSAFAHPVLLALALILRAVSSRLRIVNGFIQAVLHALRLTLRVAALAIDSALSRFMWRPAAFALTLLARAAWAPLRSFLELSNSAADALSSSVLTALQLVRTALTDALTPLVTGSQQLWRLTAGTVLSIEAEATAALRWLRAGRATIGLFLVWSAVAAFSLPARTADAAAQILNHQMSSLHRRNPIVPRTNFTRGQMMGLLAGVWMMGTVGIFASPIGQALMPQDLVVVHWANGHMMRPTLLPKMAEEFNATKPRTASGKRIKIQVLTADSVVQVDDVLSRLTHNVPLDRTRPDPTLITPSADHWIAHLNYAAGETVVDLHETRGIATTWIGIVTYREMAECLGWPQKELGYADILALRQDPRGWSAYSCARAEWGQRPLVAYTDPLTSSTGRSVLYTLYATGAGKTPERLTTADVHDAGVAGYVRQFQDVVDHYLPGTLPLNTKVHLGPHYGHFFIMPEDNLIHLYEGTERALINGVAVTAPPISRSMVMIYPKEGSASHNHSANLVRAPWVSAEQREAADQWATFLQQDAQQRAFVAGGFRPVTGMTYGEPISNRYGLDASKPTAIAEPDRIEPKAAEQIITDWQEIKKPGAVTFVLDVSGSMQGAKLTQAKAGIIRSLDGMSNRNSVGLVTFDDIIRTRVELAPLGENRFAIASAVEAARVGGNTALYDGIKAAVQMADSASVPPTSIRGVVVLTDGKANRGQTELDDLIRMSSRDESEIRQFSGFENASAEDTSSRIVAKQQIIGVSLALNTQHRILIFFIGIGDADMEVGRMLAEATGSAFQGATEKDLSTVIEEFGKYF